eukprot:scaffold37041_cov55-Phaeocystis_antarctica.AAC.6
MFIFGRWGSTSSGQLDRRCLIGGPVNLAGVRSAQPVPASPRPPRAAHRPAKRPLLPRVLIPLGVHPRRFHQIQAPLSVQKKTVQNKRQIGVHRPLSSRAAGPAAFGARGAPLLPVGRTRMIWSYRAP